MVRDVDRQLRSQIRQHVIVQLHVPLGAADPDELLMLRDERAVEARRHAAVETEFGRELDRYLSGTRPVRSFGQDPPGHFGRHPSFDRPEDLADAVPAEVAQAALRFEFAVQANVRLEKRFGAAERELDADAAKRPESLGVVDRAAQQRQSTTVHEHHAVHELHAVGSTGVGHRAQVGERRRAWLFAQDMLPRFGRADHPFATQAGRQRDVDRVDVARRKQFVVRTDGARCLGIGTIGLAFGDEELSLGDVATGDRRDGPGAGHQDSLPVLAADAGGAQESPAAVRGHRFGLRCGERERRVGREIMIGVRGERWFGGGKERSPNDDDRRRGRSSRFRRWRIRASASQRFSIIRSWPRP